MSFVEFAALVIAVGLFIYLLVALLRPENLE